MNTDFFQSLQKLSKQSQQMQEKLALLRTEGKAGGDLVVVTMNGQFVVESVHIDESLLSSDHKSVLEELLVSACADATRKVRDLIQSSMGEQWASMLNFDR